MRDGHTYAIGGVNLVVSMVGLVGGELVQLVRRVIRGADVHVPRGIDGVGRGVPLLDARLLGLGSDVGGRGAEVRHSELALIILAVVAETEEAALKPAMELRGDVSLTAT